MDGLTILPLDICQIERSAPESVWMLLVEVEFNFVMLSSSSAEVRK